jgi:putative ABC transport system permease protein
MKIMNILLSAFRALRRNKMRSFLTMLGIIIGVGTVIAMLAIGQGAQYSVEQQINSLGTNVLIVSPGSQQSSGLRMGAGTMTNLTEDDAQAIQRECPAVSLLSPGSRAGGQVIAGNMNWQTGIEGTGTDYLEIRKWKIEYGDFYTDQDIKGGAKVCVLGRTVADALFPESSPVGQTVRIRNVPCKVVGVLAKKGQNAMGQDQDDIILAPYTTVLRRLTWYPYLRQILISATSPASIPVAQAQITAVLRMRHKTAANDPDDFTIRNQADIVTAMTATTQILTVLLACIASVSLLVGGIGIMNIMLVSVTERTREIGIRLAVGARGRDILMQFLIEAVTLSAVGGIVGILLGVGSSRFISAKMSWPTLTSMDSILVAFAFSAAVGIFFGFYPARKASQLDPIDALRYE